MDRVQQMEAEPPKVFPRARVADPYKRLGVEREADFEEVESARTFLLEEYGAHRASREAVELAYDRILKEKYDIRKKTGYRSVNKKTGRRERGRSESLLQKLQRSLDHEVTRNKIINEAVVYGLMIVATFADDVGGLLAFTAVFVSMLMTTFKLYKKRLAQNPDGPYFMETPVPGAFRDTMLGLLAGAGLGSALGQMGLISTAVQGSFTIALGLLANFVWVTFLK